MALRGLKRINPVRNLIIIFLCYLSLHSHCVLAAEIQVGNAAQLNDVLAAANAGDVIKLKDGTYTGEFTLANSGTAEAAIVIKAANPGQAIFSSDSILTLAGDYSVVTGCLFDKSKVYVRGDNNRVSRNWFKDGRTASAQKYKTTGTSFITNRSKSVPSNNHLNVSSVLN